MRNSFRKTISMLLILAIAVVGLVGCNSNQNPGAQTDDAAVKELNVVISMHDNDENLIKTYNQIGENYKKLTGVTVKYEFIPDGDARTYITTQHSTGNSPDVYDSRIADVWGDYNKGFVLDLGKYLDAESPYMPGKAWKDTFASLLLNQSPDPQGVFSGVPLSVSGVRVIYNKDLMKKAGIEKTPSTIAEFFDALEKFKAIGVVPLGFPNDGSTPSINWWGHNFISQLDAELRGKMDVSGDGLIQVNEFVKATDEGMIDYTSGPLNDAFKILYEMKPYFNSDSSSTSQVDSFDMWLRGDVAMMAIGSHESSLIQGLEGLDFEYCLGYFPVLTKDQYPTSTEKSVNCGGRLVSLLAVSKTGSEAREKQAVDFLQYFTSEEPQIMLCENNFIIPPLKDIKLSDDLKWWMTSENEDILRANYVGPATSKQFKDFVDMSAQLLFSDAISFDEFCSELNTEWATCMEKLKVENGWNAENNYGIK